MLGLAPKYRAILIAGPTASGKSALALALAARHDGVIINADAMQVYDCYRVLTARPGEADLAAAPHALYGHRSNTPGYSVGTWLEEVGDLIRTSDRLPIITGGTGLYFRALLCGLADIPPTSVATRARLEGIAEKEGTKPLLLDLKSRDPVSYARIDRANSRRIIRALEVAMDTEHPLSYWQEQTGPPLLDPAHVEARLIMPDVQTTNARITARFDQMLEAGAIEEVRALCQPWHPELPANKALGAAPLAAMIAGEIPLEEARARAITATRQYAKRQRTWFRSNMIRNTRQKWQLVEP